MRLRTLYFKHYIFNILFHYFLCTEDILLDVNLIYDALTWPNDDTAKARVDDIMSEAELISWYKSTIDVSSGSDNGTVATTRRLDGHETVTVPSTSKDQIYTWPTDGYIVPKTESNIQATSNADVLLITIGVTAAVCLLVSIVGCTVLYSFIMRHRLQRSKRTSVTLMRSSPMNPQIVGEWVFAKPEPQRPPTPVTPARQTPASTPSVRRVITVENKVSWPSPYFGGNRRAPSDVVYLRSDSGSHRSHTDYEHRNGGERGTDDKRIVVWPRRE